MIALTHRLLKEVGAVYRTCGIVVGTRYVIRILGRISQIRRNANLQPADIGIGNDIRVTYHGSRVTYPADLMDSLNAVETDSPAFSAVREIFARDVYLRRFRSTPRAETFLDLGANRGVVSTLGAKVLGAKWVCGVEPEKAYAEVFDALADANSLTVDQRHRIVGLVGGNEDGADISIDHILNIYGIERLDFLKCDIEGAENSVFLDPTATFLDRTERISLELHPQFGACNGYICDRISNAGFAVVTTLPNGQMCDHATAEYLYASRFPGELIQ